MRFLYIALVAALLGATPPVAIAQDDPCVDVVDGTACPDDEDPCTVDACAAGSCGHVDVPNRSSCDPLIDAYRRATGLATLTDELYAMVAAAPLPETAYVLLTNALLATKASLVRTADALAGRILLPPPAAGETVAQARSRAAFGIARATPARVRSVRRLLRVPSVRAASGASTGDLARRAAFLYRNTSQLKRGLRRLQRVSGTFAR